MGDAADYASLRRGLSTIGAPRACAGGNFRAAESYVLEMEIRHLTDPELLSRLGALAAQERESVADVIEHLAELERRGNVADTGCTSLFAYCVRVLRYSESAAFARIRAARAATTDERVIGDLRTGALHLDAVMRLAPHLNQENSGRLLDLASGATNREVRSLVAALVDSPPPERDVIRVVASDSAAQDAKVIPPPSRVRLSFTADGDFLRMVETLKSLRRHRYPDGRLEDLLKEAVCAWLKKLTPAKLVGPQARAPHNSGRSRHIPAAVKAAVWERDGGRCAFRADNGLSCKSADFLQYDHIHPWSLGGASSVENLRLLCRSHNIRLARKRFGSRRSP